MNKKILVPVMVATLAISSMPANLCGINVYHVAKAEETLLTETVDGMVIEKGVLKRYEGNAENIIVPDGVVSIGEYAFAYKDFIKSITLPESVKEIEQYAFFQCTDLQTVINKGTIETIGAVAFSGCSNLTSIDLSKGQLIARAAFVNCKNLKEIKLDSLQEIESGAFSGSGIEKAEINFIGENGYLYNTFQDCENLKEVIIKGNLTEIRDNAFLRCKALENIQIADESKISYIGKRSFDYTPWLSEQLEQSDNKMLIINHILVKYQPNVFYAGEYKGIPYEDLTQEQEYDGRIQDSYFTYSAPSNAKMETVTIPSDVKAIAANAFYGAYSVENVIFDPEIKNIEIGEGAFDFTTWEKEYLEKEDFLIIGGNLVKANYNSEVIEVPNGVKKVVSGAFMSDCIHGKIPTQEIVWVKKIIFPQSVEEVNSWSFQPYATDSQTYALEELIVPTALETKFYGNLLITKFEDVDTTLDAKDVLEGYTPTDTAEPIVSVTETPIPTTTATKKPVPTVLPSKTPLPTEALENTCIPTGTVVSSNSPSPTVSATPSSPPQALETPIPTSTISVTSNPIPNVSATPIPSPTTQATNRPEQSTNPVTSTPVPTVTVKRAVITKAKRISNTKIRINIKKAENVKGYQIVVATDKKFKKNVKKVSTTTRKIVMKNLKKGKTYYIKARAYKLNAQNSKVYGTYSVIKKVKK